MADTTVDRLSYVLATLKGQDPDAMAVEYRQFLTDTGDRVTSSSREGTIRFLGRLENHVLQAPLAEADRTSLLKELAAVGLVDAPLPEGALNRLEGDLATRTTITPTLLRDPVRLGSMPSAFDDVFRVLVDLDAQIGEPWSLVGGLMVTLHALEAGLAPPRVTPDADVAVNVFTHRDSLRRLTGQLTALGFEDQSPQDDRKNGPSYRYIRELVKVDVLVPEKANSGVAPPRTVTGRPGVEMWGMQSAIKRTQRIPVVFDDKTKGWVRRPDLLGAVAVKSAAAIRDTDNGRHLDDLAFLSNLIGSSVDFPRFVREVTRKQRARLRKIGPDAITWRMVDDPTLAREAFITLIGD